MSVEQILQTYSSYFTVDTFFNRSAREFLWAVIKGLVYLVDILSNVTDNLFKIDTFYNNQSVINYINSFKPLIIVLFSLSFCIIGYEIMYKKKEYKQIATNLVIAIVIIIILPVAMDRFNDLTSKGVAAAKDSPQNTANQIIKSNVIDLLILDKNNFSGSGSNNISLSNIRYIDSTDTVQPDFFNSLSIKNQDVFKKKLTLSEDGKVTSDDLNKGWLTFWKNYYYRYHINFFSIIISLAIAAGTLIFISVKLVILMYELAFDKLLALLVAPADVSNGNKTKKIIENIISIYIVTFLMAVLMKFYVLFIGVASQTNGIQWILMMIGGSFATINGPSMVEKIFGIDAGVSGDGVAAIFGAAMAGRAIGDLSKKVGHGIKKAAGKSAMAGATVGGAVAGGVAGAKSQSHDEDMYKDMNNKNTEEPKGMYESATSEENQKNNEEPGIYDAEYEDVPNDNSKGIYEGEEGNINSESEGVSGNENEQSQGIYEEMGSKGTHNKNADKGSKDTEGMRHTEDKEPGASGIYSDGNSGSTGEINNVDQGASSGALEKSIGTNSIKNSNSVVSADTNTVDNPGKMYSQNSEQYENKNYVDAEYTEVNSDPNKSIYKEHTDTIGNYFKNKVKNSKVAKRAERSYEVTKNTTENVKNKLNEKG